MRHGSLVLMGWLLACCGCGSDEAGGGSAATGGAAGADGGDAATGGTGGASGAAGLGGFSGDAGSGQAGAAGNGGAHAACEAFWTLACARMEACASVAFFFNAADQSQCVAQETEACEGTVFGPGSTVTPSELDACTAALSQYTECQPWLAAYAYGEIDVPACAIPPGERGDGEPCRSGYQCASAHCSFALSDACGQCATPAKEGESCAGTQCEAPLLCLGGTCRMPSALGEACTMSMPCLNSLACVSGTCEDKSDLGEACTPTPQNDMCRYTGWCDATTEVCEPYLHAATDGGACGILSDGSLEYCAYGFVCRITDKTHFAGKCEPRAKEGAACEELYAIGDNCTYPLVCLNGTCQSSNAVDCP